MFLAVISPSPTWPLRRALDVPIATALVAGGLFGALLVLLAHAALEWAGLSAVFETMCTGCNARNQVNTAVVVNLFGFIGSAAAGVKWGPKWKGPTTTKKGYDVASPPTPEEQQEEAWDAYQDLILIKNAPEGSPGGDLNEAMDRIKKFSSGKLGLGSPP